MSSPNAMAYEQTKTSHRLTSRNRKAFRNECLPTIAMIPFLGLQASIAREADLLSSRQQRATSTVL
eukprot:1626723-Pyramimonas_sp.AAC.1